MFQFSMRHLNTQHAVVQIRPWQIVENQSMTVPLRLASAAVMVTGSARQIVAWICQFVPMAGLWMGTWGLVRMAVLHVSTMMNVN
jgi:hypothetical protein